MCRHHHDPPGAVGEESEDHLGAEPGTDAPRDRSDELCDQAARSQDSRGYDYSREVPVASILPGIEGEDNFRRTAG